MNFANNKPFKPPRGKEAAQEQNLFLKLQYTKKGIDLVILAIFLAKRSCILLLAFLKLFFDYARPPPILESLNSAHLIAAVLQHKHVKYILRFDTFLF